MWLFYRERNSRELDALSDKEILFLKLFILWKYDLDFYNQHQSSVSILLSKANFHTFVV